MDTISFYKRKPEFGVGIFIHVGMHEFGDYLFQDLLREQKPWRVQAIDVELGYTEIPDFNPGIYTRHRVTCKRRNDGFSRDAGNHNMDYWHTEDGKSHQECSFCGSITAELFSHIVDQAYLGIEGFTVEKSKNYKFYVSTPDMANNKLYAKFYTHHILDIDPDTVDGINEKLTRIFERQS
jgi:hypothetical protein